MDTYEATKIVMSRIQTLDPDNASKIMGYMLIQDQGEKEMIRLAFGPESLLLSYINQAKACLGLSSNSPSPNPSPPLANPVRPGNHFPQGSPRILIPNNGFHFSNPSSPAAGFPSCSPRPISYAAVLNGSNNGSGSSGMQLYGGNDFGDEQLPFLDDSMVDPIMSPSGRSDSLIFPYGDDVPSPHPNPFHRRSCSVNDAAFLEEGAAGGGFGWRPCMYYARGFCKNGDACKFLHGDGGGETVDVGSPSKSVSGFDDLLRMKALQQQRFALMAAGCHHPFAYNKCMNFHNENPRSAAAALMMGDEFSKFNRCRPDRNGFSPMGLGGGASSSSRQIYLTFPADSTFKEEDVSGYFSMFGPVQDVRIPYQQKRMFGFVTFVYPETVKRILEKGNPHFVCDSRVLVKPYKEKGKVQEKKQQNQHLERGEYSACLSPTGGDSGEPFDIPYGSRMLLNAQEMMLRRKMEQEAELQHALEIQGRRLMNLQLFDLKNQRNCPHFIPGLPAGAQLSPPSQARLLVHPNVIASGNMINQEVSEEFDGALDMAKSPGIASDNVKLLLQETESSANNDADSGNKHQRVNGDDPDLPGSLEHILPDNLFSSPTKLAAERQSMFSHSVAASDDSMIAVTNTSSNNPPAMPTGSPLGMSSLKSCFQMPRKFE